MKKTLYTLCVDNYEPEITALTFPLLKRYAEKIQADFFVIKERKFPHLPPVMEKFQIRDLAVEHKNDWNIYLDADTLVHPDFFDVTSILKKDTTCSHGRDFTPIRWRPDNYFLRDGRFEGKGNWCAIVSDWCLDYYDYSAFGQFDELVENIFPTVHESNTVIKRDHLMDDYLVSRNIARFGLKHVLIPNLCQANGVNPVQYPQGVGWHLWHIYTVPAEQKLIEMQKVLKCWGVKP